MQSFELNSGEQQPKIAETKARFESQNISASLLNIPHKELKSGGIDKKLGFELVWEQAVNYDHNDLNITEVPVALYGKMSISIKCKECSDEKDTKVKEAPTKPTLRLVIQKNKQTGETKNFMMTIIGDPVYMGKIKHKLGKNHYLNMDTEFTGEVLFSDLNGNFVNGYIYQGGTIQNKVKSLLADVSSSNLKSEVCYYQTHYVCYQYCTGTIINGEEVDETCVDAGCYSYDEILGCYDDGPDGGDGSYGGDGSDGSGSTGANIVDSLKNYPCAESTLTYIAGTNQGDCINTELTSLLQNTFGVNNEVNLTFIAMDLSADEDGKANPLRNDTNGNLSAAINTDILNTASGPYLAATMLHEGLHAYFNYESGIDPNFSNNYVCFGTNSLGQLITLNGEGAQHEYMTKYVEAIATAVQAIYPKISYEDAVYLSWGGLQMTQAYKLNKANCDAIFSGDFLTKMNAINKAHRAAGGCGNYR
jgi:hypothetical protein